MMIDDFGSKIDPKRTL